MNSPQKMLLSLVSQFAINEGFNPTPVQGVSCIKISVPYKPTKSVWRSCVAIVIQGAKKVVLENHVYNAGPFHYTASPIDLPTISSIPEASVEKPFLALLIDFDSVLLSKLTAELDKVSPESPEPSSKMIFVGVVDKKMIGSTIRLAELFERPNDAHILGKFLVQELFYYLLIGENGHGVRNFVRSGSDMQKVARVIYKIKEDLSEKINVTELARASNMSRSRFFQHFKKASSMSPIQYQKRLRLIEARRLMTEVNETAERAAYNVGYNSVSQFSREYSRMFGNPPIKDVIKLKKLKADL